MKPEIIYVLLIFILGLLAGHFLTMRSRAMIEVKGNYYFQKSDSVPYEIKKGNDGKRNYVGQ